jgi:hypothetical protein
MSLMNARRPTGAAVTFLSLLPAWLLAAHSVPAQSAGACATGWSDKGGGVCEKVLDYNGTATAIGTVQYVTVPANVTSMTMVVAGASGQASLDTGEGTPAAGGKGGRQTGTIPVVPGDTLAVYVGEAGDTVPQAPTHGWQLSDPLNPGAYTISGAFGGGGLSSSNYGGFGGGGSFVFDSQPIPGDPGGATGNLLIAAGGGGGAGYDLNQFATHGAYGPQKNNGGAGSGATPASDGVAVGFLTIYGGTGYSPGPGRGATPEAGGAGGVPSIPSGYAFGQVSGGSGWGPATIPDATNPAYTSSYLGAGGNAVKGTCCYYYGEAGAGGGGYFGGGGGGSIEAEYQGGGGGGGAGFIVAAATNAVAETGVRTGDGQVTLKYVVAAAPSAYTLAPNALDFGNQAPGVASTGQAVTLANTGGAVLQLSSVKLTGTNASQFTLSNGCGTSVAVGATCTLTVKFKPSSVGVKIAAVTVTPGGSVGAQSVSLTGTGMVPVYSLDKLSLDFGIVALGASSTSQAVTLTNTGAVAMPISSARITIAGTDSTQFTRKYTCGSSVPAGGSCTISVTFKPASIGAKGATLSVTGGGGAGTRTVALSAAGAVAQFTLDKSALDFATQPVGTTSTARIVKLTNTGTVALPISSSGIAFSGADATQFTRSFNCGTSVAVGASCAISIKFKPTSTGPKSATLNVTGGGGAGTQTVVLSGTGG